MSNVGGPAVSRRFSVRELINTALKVCIVLFSGSRCGADAFIGLRLAVRLAESSLVTQHNL